MSPGTILYSTCAVLDAPADTRGVLLHLSPGDDSSRVLLATGEIFVGTSAEIAQSFVASDEFYVLPSEIGDANEGLDDAVFDALIKGRLDAVLRWSTSSSGGAL